MVFAGDYFDANLPFIGYWSNSTMAYVGELEDHRKPGVRRLCSKSRCNGFQEKLGDKTVF